MSRLEAIILRFLGRALYAALVLRDLVRRTPRNTPGIGNIAIGFNHVRYDIVDDSTGEVVGHVVGHKEKP